MKCSECGKQALFADKLKNVFCTNECYFVYRKVSRPVQHFSLHELLDDEKYRNLFYTDENLQMTTQTLKSGEKIGIGKNNSEPEIHPNATQTFILFAGSVKVTIFSEEKSESLMMGLGKHENQIVIVPPNTFHLVENTGPVIAHLLITYAPAVHTEEEK